MKSFKLYTVIFLLYTAVLFLPEYTFAQNFIPKTGSEGMWTQTELRYWDSTKTRYGYTLFGARGKSYLIDMEGYIINTWNVGTNPRFVAGGNILDAATDNISGYSGFKEVDWNGNTVWQYFETRTGTYFPHHDWTRIYNKKLQAYTTLYIANKSVTSAQALAAGCNPANGPYNNCTVDAIVEVDMSGTIVWEWWFFNHIIQDFDSTKQNYVGAGKTIANYPQKININMPGQPLKNDWIHCNSIDYNDTLDQILINGVNGEYYIIDHGNTFLPGNPAGSIALAATSAGDFLYRFGDPARYNQGNPPSILSNWTTSTTGHKQIGASHDAHWIKPGLQGAGNIMVFNNGQYLFERTSQSYIVEVNPYYDSNRVAKPNYVNPPAAGYYVLSPLNNDTHKQKKLISKQTVWMYNSKSNMNFFSHIGGGSQRLPGGNTLICSDTEGHLFEVTYGSATEDSKVVWEYINPITKDGIKRVIQDNYPMYNSVFRAYRYYADDPYLSGKTLTRKNTITGRTPSYFTPEDSVLLSGEYYNSEAAFIVTQNYPNPFNPSTVIKYLLIRDSFVSLKVYDILGKEVADLVNEYQSPGSYSFVFDAGKIQNAHQLSAGVYFFRLSNGAETITKKMIFAK